MSQEVASAALDPSTIAPDTGKPMSNADRMRFMIGFVIFGVMWMMSGTIGSDVLFPERFNSLGDGQGEAILAAMSVVGSVVALIANLVFGALSDACRSRFGRRTPFILVGGLICGAAFWATANATEVVGICIAWGFLQVGLNCMLAPAAAVLSDRIPECNRGTISAFYGGGQTVGWSIGVMIGTHFITNPLPGFVVGTVCWCLTGLLTLVIWPNELPANSGEASKLNLASLGRAFVPPTKNCRDFYLALVGRLLFIFGYKIINGYQLYILEKYVGLEAAEAGTVLSTMSVIIMVISFVSSIVSGLISDKIGRRKPIVLIASIFVAISMIMPWLTPSVFAMYFYAAVGGLGYGIYISVDQALNVDVLPSKDEAGKDLGILNMANTIGQVLAPIVASNIVLVTGSYFLTFPTAVVLVLAGTVFIMTIKKTK